MHLGQGYFLLLMSVAVAAYDVGNHNLVAAPLQLETYIIRPNRLDAVSIDRLNAIPVVPRPSGFQRPSGFRRPTTTRRPFRKRPTTPRPQPLPVVRPQARPPAPPPELLPTTATPLPPPLQLPSETPLETATETPQLPVVVPEVPPSTPNLSQNQIAVVSQPQPTAGITSVKPGDGSQPLTSQFQPPTESVSQPFGTLNGGVPTVAQNPDTIISQIPVFSYVNVLPQTPSAPEPPTFLRPPAPSQGQLEAQPPFEGPNLPPNLPTSPTFASSQTNTGASGFRPQEPLVFPVARPPLSAASRPPFRPRPQPSEKPPNAQPPFDAGPHVPPKPPPVPVTSTTSFAVNPPNGKPQRPLPPSRPILQNPLPPPKPPYQLTTTEKPAIIFNESSMTDEGNYTFDFLVSNSVYRKEQGFLKKSLLYPGHLILVKTGAYSFTSPEGTFHRVDFVADERGYRAFESS